jgi:serralysin
MTSLRATTTYTYDANCKLISENIDYDGNGIVDSVITYRYKRIPESFDDDGDGIADRSTVYNGDRISESVDNNNDGTPDFYLQVKICHNFYSTLVQ